MTDQQAALVIQLLEQILAALERLNQQVRGGRM